MIWNENYGNELLTSSAIVAAVRRPAEQVAARARSAAPVDTGEYRSSIRVRIKFQKRAVAVIEAGDHKSLILESKYGVLARALGSVAK